MAHEFRITGTATAPDAARERANSLAKLYEAAQAFEKSAADVGVTVTLDIAVRQKRDVKEGTGTAPVVEAAIPEEPIVELSDAPTSGHRRHSAG